MPRKRTICYVTGTRAEFGLMARTLRAIKSHPSLTLQLVVTGMHLDARHGRSIDLIRREGVKIDAVVPWQGGDAKLAHSTGTAMAAMARAFDRLNPDIVLVTGDRVEPFAAASAAYLSNRLVAHVHGGDRALGQVDDTLRHAITKLSHIHFAATPDSAQRIVRLGEERSRVHQVGSPGIEAIERDCAPWSRTAKPSSLKRFRYALVLLHPADGDVAVEWKRAWELSSALLASDIEGFVFLYSNNDPGSSAIVRCWEGWHGLTRVNTQLRRAIGVYKDLPRAQFLSLLKHAAVLIGNSSSGILEAASFGTPVIDIGPRQLGRLHSKNLVHVPYDSRAIGRALARIWNNGRPKRATSGNIYAGRSTSRRIAQVLSSIPLNDRLRQKLIAY